MYVLFRSLAGLALVAGATAPLAAENPLPPDAVIQQILDERVAEKRTFGVVLGTIDSSGRIRLYHAGSSGQEGVSLDGDSVFEIGSISKTFNTALLADMVVRGEVKLDDPVAKYLPATVKIPERGGKQITLYDLAIHSSGLPRLPSNLHPADMSNPYADYRLIQGAQIDSKLPVLLQGNGPSRPRCMAKRGPSTDYLVSAQQEFLRYLHAHLPSNSHVDD